MTERAIAIDPTARNQAPDAPRSANGGDAFAATLRSAVGAHRGGAGDAAALRDGEFFAPSGISGMQDSRDRSPSAPANDQDPSALAQTDPPAGRRGRKVGGTPESWTVRSISPDSAAAALLISPHEVGALQAPAPISAVAEHSRGDLTQALSTGAERRTRSSSDENSLSPKSDAPTRGAVSKGLSGTPPAHAEAAGAAPATGAVPQGVTQNNAAPGESTPAGPTDRAVATAGSTAIGRPVNSPASAAGTSGSAGTTANGQVGAVKPSQNPGAVRAIGAMPGVVGAGRTTQAVRTRMPETAEARLMQAEEEPPTAQVTRGLAAALRQRGGSITVRLNPESLGQVRIDLTLDGVAVRARVEAASDHARDLLARDASSLRDSLESRGLTVDDLQIVTREHGPAEARHLSAGNASPDGSSAEARHDAGGGDGSGRGMDDRSGDRAGDRPSRDDAGIGTESLLGAPSAHGVWWESGTLRLDAVA